MKKTLKELKQGEYFTLKPIEYPTDKQVFIRGEYERSEKKYSCGRCDDIWGYERFLKGSTIVYTDFTY